MYMTNFDSLCIFLLFDCMTFFLFEFEINTLDTGQKLDGHTESLPITVAAQSVRK